jgi:hypothetical protein
MAKNSVESTNDEKPRERRDLYLRRGVLPPMDRGS